MMPSRNALPRNIARPPATSRPSRVCQVCGCLPVDWLKIATVCSTLNVGKSTVCRMVREGRLSAARFGNVLRIRHRGKDANGVPGLDEFLAECEEK